MTTQRQKRFESSKERKQGAKLIITKKNEYQTEGELITVKKDSLLILTKWTGRDESIDIADIKVIRVVKKGGTGALVGALIGGGGGVLVALKEYPKYDREETGIGHLFTFLFGGIGAGIGAIIGAAAGRDKTIQMEGMTESEIQETLDKLRKKARIRDYK
jgi:hypothetical protein